uniref:Uncharacterized protein n=1 Tax=Candidatus Kentrum sp. TC TaxID=2126339 RepID=A0A450ZZG7_9GAMM|nr:MAG: hypothetical protein BECKTC1821F_GA0114240_10309 [Candidatus Kentron sp. TC]
MRIQPTRQRHARLIGGVPSPSFQERSAQAEACAPAPTHPPTSRQMARIETNHRNEFTVVLEQDEDGAWVGECLSMPGCVSRVKRESMPLPISGKPSGLCLEVRVEREMVLNVRTLQLEMAA